MPGCHGGRRPRGHTALNRSGPLCRPTRPRRDRDSGSRRSRAIAAVIAGLRCQMSAHCIWRLGHRTLPRRRPAGLADARRDGHPGIDSARVCLPPRSVPSPASRIRRCARVTSPRADWLAARCSTRGVHRRSQADRLAAAGRGPMDRCRGLRRAWRCAPAVPRSRSRGHETRIPGVRLLVAPDSTLADPHDGRLVRRLHDRRRDAVAGWYDPTQMAYRRGAPAGLHLTPLRRPPGPWMSSWRRWPKRTQAARAAGPVSVDSGPWLPRLWRSIRETLSDNDFDGACSHWPGSQTVTERSSLPERMAPVNALLDVAPAAAA